MTKKNTPLRKIVFTIFVFSMILIFVFIYFFPTVKKINRLKRDIRETTLEITDLQTEKSFFIGSDKKELKLFKSTKRMVGEKLTEIKNSKNLKVTLKKFKNLIRNKGKILKISGLIVKEQASELQKSDDKLNRPIIKGLYFLPVTISFNSGLSSASELLNSLVLSELYVIPKKITASRNGERFGFIIDVEIYFKYPKDRGSKNLFDSDINELIDPDSPFLQKPIYQSPIKPYFFQNDRDSTERR